VNLLDHRLIVVVGKGGVGRTTCSAALGLAAARLGKRVLLVELGGTDHLTRALGVPPTGFTPRRVAEGVDAMSLTALDCLDDFGSRKLRLSRVVALVLRSRVIQAFIDAIPGLHDLLQLGKIENLLMEPMLSDEHYDLCVLDAPATGHGLTLLAAAGSMREMTRVGPFADLAGVIETFLSGPQCAVVPVTVLEELPVQETAEMLAALQLEGFTCAALVANRVPAPSLPARPAWHELRPRLEGAVPAALLAMADAEHAAAQRRASALERLGATSAAPVWALPNSDTPVPARALADALVPLLEGA
jgi:anion-transporting  ArsA/GET3 family ATPase